MVGEGFYELDSINEFFCLMGLTALGLIALGLTALGLTALGDLIIFKSLFSSD